MKKGKKLIVANWKVNPITSKDANKIVDGLKKVLPKLKQTTVVVCPSFVYISEISKKVSGKIVLGSQNAFYESQGSYTGEVSFSQLKGYKVQYVILGHSERRILGETDEIINRKVRAVADAGMTAILCIGEKDRDEHGNYLTLIKNQILVGLKDVAKKNIDNIVIAYEPVWAIGAKEAMNPTGIHEMSLYIRKVLREMYGSVSDSVLVLYGGAASADNAEAIVHDGFVDGLLVGRASLDPKGFAEMIRQVDRGVGWGRGGTRI